MWFNNACLCVLVISCSAKQELVNRALEAWRLRHADLDQGMLAKGCHVTSCCACRGDDGCAIVPSLAAARRLTPEIKRYKLEEEEGQRGVK